MLKTLDSGFDRGNSMKQTEDTSCLPAFKIWCSALTPGQNRPKSQDGLSGEVWTDTVIKKDFGPKRQTSDMETKWSVLEQSVCSRQQFVQQRTGGQCTDGWLQHGRTPPQNNGCIPANGVGHLVRWPQMWETQADTVSRQEGSWWSNIYSAAGQQFQIISQCHWGRTEALSPQNQHDWVDVSTVAQGDECLRVKTEELQGPGQIRSYLLYMN